MIGSFIAPPDLGFGDIGIPGRVPPNASLFYTIELVDILDVPLASVTENRKNRAESTPLLPIIK